MKWIKKLWNYLNKPAKRYLWVQTRRDMWWTSQEKFSTSLEEVLSDIQEQLTTNKEFIRINKTLVNRDQIITVFIK